ncbi:hypothetical protein [Sulfoacidibacillus ferrooxidans]|uniref:Uncharacterized protein n=1 Tax=Sulfoacidibacillus ferrooxidans TaxID=2005001 RepID=A0A9X1VCS4_9BACL|nr:hypothetical protein [Sulfoacidibacillus ferrooxidans]MCI0183682.1 hypothetical protein [Sulfoacidibacillus ferrooxidans]
MHSDAYMLTLESERLILWRITKDDAGYMFAHAYDRVVFRYIVQLLIMREIPCKTIEHWEETNGFPTCRIIFEAVIRPSVQEQNHFEQ